jgi:hypothetical protein
MTLVPFDDLASNCPQLFPGLLPVPSVRKGRHPSTQTDDGIDLETWNRLRTLLQHPRFIYVADCKLCTEKNLRMIDGERGFVVTVVPKIRSEAETSRDAVLAGDVRWEEILRKRADRDEKAFYVIKCAVGPYHLREGFTRTDRVRRRSAMRKIATCGSIGR